MGQGVVCFFERVACAPSFPLGLKDKGQLVLRFASIYPPVFICSLLN